MLRVDPSLFSNVVTAVQRTSSLTGGAVRGLPNGAVIEGLKGVQSIGSDISEAQKEFQLGRVRSALERVKQIEMNFSGVAGRWNSTVASVISSAKQGQQKLSLQKLNEVRSAQTKMQQLTGPATKAFRDLASALEQALAEEGRTASESAESATKTSPDKPTVSADRPPQAEPAVDRASAEPDEELPDVDLLGRFMLNYRFGPKLQLHKGANNKVHIVPRLEKDQFYFASGFDPGRVVRIRDIQRGVVLMFDTHTSSDVKIAAFKLKSLIRRGMWLLVSKQPNKS